jgi:4-amino-4-deoxy-L-arabinose transferase-like glycosyltransferase
MENLTSIVTIFFCFIGGFLSWRYCNNYNLKHSIFILLMISIILRLYTGMDFYLHAWDERYHALVSKHFIIHPFIPTLYENPLLNYDLNDWGANHIWLSKPPVAMWLASISIKFFGNHELAVRFPSILLSTLSVGLTFKIGRLLFDQRTAFIAALLHAINGMLIQTAAARLSSDIVETTFLFFSEAAILMALYSVKKDKPAVYSIFCGLFTGLAFLSKWTPAIFILPVWLTTIYSFNKKKNLQQLSLFIFPAIGISASWCIYMYYAFPREAKEMLSSLIRPLNEVIQEHQGPVYYYLIQIQIIFGEIVYLPLAWFMYRTVTHRGELKYSILIAWLFVPLIVFSLSATKRATYILIAAPALFLIIAHFYTWLEQQSYPGYRRWLKFLVLFLLIALPVRYCIERVKPFSADDRNPAWAQELKQLPERKDKKIVLFNYPLALEAMFYTDFAAVYGYIPELATLRSLQQQGYTIWVRDDGKLQPELRAIPGIRFRKFSDLPQR